MRAAHDDEAGATYVYLTDRPVARTVALSDSVNVDLDADGNPCGVEVLEATSRPLLDRVYGVGCETCDWVGVMENAEPCPGCDPVGALTRGFGAPLRRLICAVVHGHPEREAVWSHQRDDARGVTLSILEHHVCLRCGRELP